MNLTRSQKAEVKRSEARQIELEVIYALQEVSNEITRLNQAAGHTVFNPATTAMVRTVLAELNDK